MNQKAEELGLTNTHFITPHGLDETEHYTTAYELALITDYALKNQKFASIVNTVSCQININGQPRTLSNTNELLGNLNGVDGVKTGFTNGAGRCLVTSITRDGHQIICVVLGADTKKIRTTDSVKLIEYTFSNYKYINVKEKIQKEFQQWTQQQAPYIEYNKAQQVKIEYILEENEVTWIPVLENKEKDIKVSIEYENIIEAPAKKGQKIGKIKVTVKDEVLLTSNILLNQEVPKKEIGDYLSELLYNYANYLISNMETIR